MIGQFKEGLNSCGGLWETVQAHWRMFLPLMTSAQQKAQTLEEFKQLFTACFSYPDQRRRREEEATAQQWEAILTMVRGREPTDVENSESRSCGLMFGLWILSDHKADFSFEDLLTFITGAGHRHPLGLSSQIYLRFYVQVSYFLLTIVTSFQYCQLKILRNTIIKVKHHLRYGRLVLMSLLSS